MCQRTAFQGPDLGFQASLGEVGVGVPEPEPMSYSAMRCGCLPCHPPAEHASCVHLPQFHVGFGRPGLHG